MSSYLFIESEGFTQVSGGYFGTDEGLAEFQSYLIERPLAGTPIPGAGPLRKVRWRDAKRQKSKRGGLRVIYIVIPDLQTFYLLDVYGKDEADDLTSSEKRELKAMAEELIKELRERNKREAP